MPLTRPQVYLRRRIAVFGSAAALLAAGLYLPFTLLAPVEPVAASIGPFEPPVSEPVALAMPSYGASAIGAVGFAGTLASGGSTEALPIASITKVITALVVLAEHPLDDGAEGPSISFGKTDVAIYRKFLADNGKVAPVSATLTLSQRDVVEVMLIESANNYAESLAVWAFGSEPAFLEAARSWLDEHDLDDTQLSDSTGMSPANVSTAADLVALGKIALAHPIVAEIVATKSESIAGVGELENSNELLGIDGIRGIKTGTLDEAGACLLFATDFVVGSETVTVVGVVLGAGNHAQLNSQVLTLLADVRAGLHEVELAVAGDAFASYVTPWGQHTQAVAAEAARAVVWSDTPVVLLVRVDKVTIATRGAAVGELVFTVGERTVTTPLVLSRSVEDPGAWWRLTNPFALL